MYKLGIDSFSIFLSINQNVFRFIMGRCIKKVPLGILAWVVIKSCTGSGHRCMFAIENAVDRRAKLADTIT